jgi:2-polyprenyl-3-methyl-5-hydroxy-6-metoxy-1,4-benzoquinol methylase
MDKELIFNTIKKAAKAEKRVKICELCSGKSVLDVGCAGQDFDYNNPEWLHNRIMGVALDLDGVDIETEAIRALREKGYSVYSEDELKLSGKKYEIIIMADVIEHVNDPVAFLRFYSSFISTSGKIIITTPNAHAIRNFTSILVRNNYSVNPQHTFWLCPKTMLEITERAGLVFAEFFWLEEYFTFRDVKGLKYKIIFIINKVFQKIRSNFYPNFMLVVSK